MRNSISEFPYISPRCPKLSSLLLQDNDLCGSIPDPFFVHLRGLNVLDLSNTRIESLPGSVSDLENLSTLRLTLSKFKACSFISKTDSIKEVGSYEIKKQRNTSWFGNASQFEIPRS